MPSDIPSQYPSALPSSTPSANPSQGCENTQSGVSALCSSQSENFVVNSHPCLFKNFSVDMEYSIRGR